MKIRTRLFLAFIVATGLGFYALIDWLLDDLRPRYLETMEESMIDNSTILASWISSQAKENMIALEDLRSAFTEGKQRAFSARIYEYTKTSMAMRVYVTDTAGTVLFDSDNSKDEGKDYSRWNDVVKTLRGEYGARATRTDPDDPQSVILYVASPIMSNGKVIGVLTVCKSADSINRFLETAKGKILFAGILTCLSVVLLVMVVSAWITMPIQRLTSYARSVRDGAVVTPPRLGSSEIGDLGAAFEEMRETIEGKHYVENYVQALTHEMKGPISSIRGAAELLTEEMPAEDRQSFVANIRSEINRMQNMVDRLLQLSALENRKSLRDVETFDISNMTEEAIASMSALFVAKEINVITNIAPSIIMHGERFLIRQALANLLHNSLAFTADGGELRVSLSMEAEHIELWVLDNGVGIPEYATGRVFDRFYSLQRPDTGKKSSGLGLTFVRETAKLHNGEIVLENQTDGGVRAILRLPTGLHPE